MSGHPHLQEFQAPKEGKSETAWKRKFPLTWIYIFESLQKSTFNTSLKHCSQTAEVLALTPPVTTLQGIILRSSPKRYLQTEISQEW